MTTRPEHNFRKFMEFRSPIIVVLMGVPGSGKSTIARELAKLIKNALCYSEGEECSYPSELKYQLKHLQDAGNALAAYNYFRNIRAQNVAKACEDKCQGRSVILDCYFDKLMADMLDQERDAMDLFISRKHADFPLIKAIADNDREVFPNVDLLIFLKTTPEMQRTFLIARNRDFELDYSQLEEMQDVFLKASKNYTRKNGQRLVIVEQELGVQKVVEKIVEIFEEQAFVKGSVREQIAPIQNLYTLLRQGQRLTVNQCASFIDSSLNDSLPEQLASLATQLLLLSEMLTPAEKVVRAILRRKLSEVDHYLAILENSQPAADWLDRILSKTNLNTELYEHEIELLLKSFDRDQVSRVFMAIWLMTVTYRGLSKANMHHMIRFMRDSGEIFDCRNSPELGFRKITRRYPTGGLSEKIALIMPSLISAFANRYPIASNFLVAKAMSYTGGTWDKLNAIPGFWFPRQGEEAVEVMQKCHVAMSVTNENFNSLDRKLYQFRGVTGCVESVPLITASIASKLLGIPADFVLMDVRYGAGTFASNFEQGKALGSEISEALQQQGIECDFQLTEAAQPDGRAIGPALEVIEAITVMKGDSSPASFQQRHLVVKMFAKMMFRLFPEFKSESAFEREIEQAFSEGKVLQAFRRVLAAHRVESQTIDMLIEKPRFLISQFCSHVIAAKHAGIVTWIDQKKLGSFVNFELNTGLNEYMPAKRNGAGVMLNVRKGDAVEAGDVLCSVIAIPGYIQECAAIIDDYFTDIFVY